MSARTSQSKEQESQAKKFNGQEILRDLIPLNALTEDRFREIATSLAIEDIGAGRYLFGEGDHDNRSIYLLDGVVNFIDRSGKVTGVVSAGTDPARYPLANRHPRMVTARAATKVVVASIDSTLLDVMLTLDQSAETGAVQVSPNTEQDWMSRLLQADSFARLAPSDIQRMIQALEPVNYSAGDTVLRQGDEGDYFYIIRSGTCSVTRLASGKGWDVPLAELGAGDCFGEDALASDGHRNATVTMLTDGTLMRLSKQQFLDILKKQLVHYVSYELAETAVASGDRWLDVRLAEEHAENSLDDSTNIPLATLRANTLRLDPGTRYIVYCDTGRRSAAAAFLLSQRGFDVAVLEGGLNRIRPPETTPAAQPAQAQPAIVESIDRQDAVAATISTFTDSGKVPAKPVQDDELRLRLAAQQQNANRLEQAFKAWQEKVARLEAAGDAEHAARKRLEQAVTSLIRACNSAT